MCSWLIKSSTEIKKKNCTLHTYLYFICDMKTIHMRIMKNRCKLYIYRSHRFFYQYSSNLKRFHFLRRLY